jgi:hypothetical protein
MNDWIQNSFKSIDVSVFIFIITYSPLLIFAGYNIKKPDQIAQMILAYGLLLFARTICIGVLPLCEPNDAIPLNDPFLNNVFYPNGYSPYDLFFSGHVATLFLLSRIEQHKIRYLFLGLSVVLGILVILQKTHYTIDVLGAYPIAYVLYRLSLFLRLKFKLDVDRQMI